MKVRHYLKTYRTLPDFPRCDDIYHELSQNNKIKKGKVFSYSNMRRLLTFNISQSIWLKKIEELINLELVEQVDKNNYKLVIKENE